MTKSSLRRLMSIAGEACLKLGSANELSQWSAFAIVTHLDSLSRPGIVPQPPARIGALFSGSLILCEAKIIPQTSLVIFQGDHYCLTEARRCAEYQSGCVVYTVQ